MATGIFDISRGRIIEIADKNNLVVLLMSQTQEINEVTSYNTVDELLSNSLNNECDFNGYVRKTNVEPIIIVDTESDMVFCDIPDVTWEFPTSETILQNADKVVIAYEKGDDLIPLTIHDFQTPVSGSYLRLISSRIYSGISTYIPTVFRTLDEYVLRTSDEEILITDITI